ncbi:MAG: molybdopterin molybdotransferase MoeA [Saprospiraceae bacterium]|nr:molybdopterin molybdotransferase MoeA [Saprospiraceae bacterium]
MITVEEAEKIILKTAKNQKNTEGVILLKAIGKILADDILADRDFPPSDRVTMDGIALNYASFETGQRHFLIENTQAAGQKQIKLKNKNNCIEVMTGAMMPKDCNTVVRYEDLKIENNFAEIQLKTIDYQQNTHKKGSDRKRRDVLIPKGTYLTAAEIGTAATVGQAIVKVVTMPKVAIISTGDELVEITESPEDYQIRRSNVYAIAALLTEKCKITAQLFHFNDNETEITEGVKAILKKYDLVIFSGAVSEGKFDFVPKALESNQVKCLFHKVAQRPGKPLWFGQQRSGAVVFGLPGNPVSTFMCACRYVLPWLKTYLLQNNANTVFAVLAEDVPFTPNLTYYLQVKIQNQNGVLMAYPVAGSGSGDLANLNDADGFLELPMDKSAFLKGEVFRFIGFR